MIQTRQIVYNEVHDCDEEVLTGDGVDLLLAAFFTDIRQYLVHTEYSGDKSITTPSWDVLDSTNWDYMLMGLTDIINYCDFMSEVCEVEGDYQTVYDYTCAIAVLDDIEQMVGEIHDYMNESSTNLIHDLDSSKFWLEFFNSLTLVKDFIDPQVSNTGGFHD